MINLIKTVWSKLFGRQTILLRESNTKELKAFKNKYTKKPNGVSCENCGAELLDLYPGLIDIPNPPQTLVVCDNCGWSGHRIYNA